MKCPFCGCVESKVIDSRPTDDGEKIRRRRECIGCQKRFTTFEAIETIPLYVIKKDSTRERFSRDKILGGLMRACEKRPVSIESLEKIAEAAQTDKKTSGSSINVVLLEKIGTSFTKKVAISDLLDFITP